MPILPIDISAGEMMISEHLPGKNVSSKELNVQMISVVYGYRLAEHVNINNADLLI